ncbi:MAG: flavin reductase [Alphaproteobacteria bacterium]
MTTAKAIDVTELRKALGCFVTGVTIVTTIDGHGRPRGFTANSFTSVSLEPPLVLVCIAHSAGSLTAFSEAGHFAVNILAQVQREVSRAFASPRPDKFETVAWRPGRAGSPLIAGTVAWLECAARQRIEAGDHVIIIGEVVDLGHSTLTPLGYARGNYLSFGLEQQALGSSPGRPVRVGAILEAEEKILLLIEAGSGHLVLPSGASLGNEKGEAASLMALLRSLGVEAKIEFLFAVFDDAATGGLSIYYRGEISGTARLDPARARLVPLEDIRWDDLPDDGTRGMLRRYASERLLDRFGIYVGTAEAGTVRPLDEGA